jgi:hypothetical protein
MRTLSREHTHMLFSVSNYLVRFPLYKTSHPNHLSTPEYKKFSQIVRLRRYNNTAQNQNLGNTQIQMHYDALGKSHQRAKSLTMYGNLFIKQRLKDVSSNANSSFRNTKNQFYNEQSINANKSASTLRYRTPFTRHILLTNVLRLGQNEKKRAPPSQLRNRRIKSVQYNKELRLVALKHKINESRNSQISKTYIMKNRDTMKTLKGLYWDNGFNQRLPSGTLIEAAM